WTSLTLDVTMVLLQMDPAQVHHANENQFPYFLDILLGKYHSHRPLFQLFYDILPEENPWFVLKKQGIYGHSTYQHLQVLQLGRHLDIYDNPHSYLLQVCQV